MKTPAERRFRQASAQAVSAKADPAGVVAGNAYELMLAKLDDDRRRLHSIQSVERKIEVKREILPEYQEWVSGALAGGQGAQDDVLAMVMVWQIDVGDFDRALDIAEYVLRHGLTMPDQYQRSVATVLVDEISDSALAAARAGQPYDVQILERLQKLTQDSDMPDQARAKLHKAIGLRYKECGQYAGAVRELARALELHDKAGCKNDLKEAEKLLKEQEAKAST